MNTETVSFPGLGWSFDVPTNAFTIGNITIAWYGIFIACGMGLAILYFYFNHKRFNLDLDKTLNLIIAGIIAAIIGARAYYVIMKHEDYNSFAEIINIRQGGLAIYGGIIAGLLTALIMCKIQKQRVLPIFDMAGICLLIGQGIGRWGNFFNKEAFGSNTDLPWGMTSPTIQSYLFNIAPGGVTEKGVELTYTQPVHPCFFYEFIWCLLGFLLLHFFSKHRKYDGQVFLMYIGWYGLGRVFIEGLRTDSLYVGNIRISQLIAALCVITSIVLLVYNEYKRRRLAAENELPAEPIIVKSTDDISEELAEFIAKDTVENTVKGTGAVVGGVANTAANATGGAGGVTVADVITDPVNVGEIVSGVIDFIFDSNN